MKTLRASNCLALITLGLIGAAASAQTARPAAPQAKPTAAVAATVAVAPASECPPGKADECPPAAPRDDEQDRAVRPKDPASPQLVGDAPLPLVGLPAEPPTLRFERGPLKAQSYGLSLGVDHPLSRQWVAGALLGWGRGRLQRSQTEFSTTAGATQVVQSDTTVRTRNATLAASLSYFPHDALALDGSVSYMRTQLDTRRVVDASTEFTGENVGSSLGLWLSASRVWRFGPRAVVPQLGLEYVNTRIDPLSTVARDLAAPAVPTEGFRVSAQRQHTLTAQLSTQVQRPYSTRWGTLTPYLRGSWRERLWAKSNAVTADAPFAYSRRLDTEAASIRRSLAVAGGGVAQLTRGVGSFAELSHQRGSSDLRETRVSLGLRFER